MNGSSTHPSVEVLLEAYRTRVQLLITQGNRLWTRFNYFLAIEVALGALYFIYSKQVAIVIGIVFSLVWYCLAANDHYYLKLDRRRVRYFEENYLVYHTGGQLKPLYTDSITMKSSWIHFNIKHLRVSCFSVYFPVIFTVFWSLLFLKKIF